MSGSAWRSGRLLLLGLLLVPLTASAELTVIYDSGETRPLAPLLEVLAGEPEGADAVIHPRLPLGAADIEALLPIHSEGLSPGPVTRRVVEQSLVARPFFLVGSDPLSRRWLATHRERLLAIGAVGMLVEAETVEDVRAITAIARGLPLLPAPASDIASALGLVHYPVLVSRLGIEQ